MTKYMQKELGRKAGEGITWRRTELPEHEERVDADLKPVLALNIPALTTRKIKTSWPANLLTLFATAS